MSSVKEEHSGFLGKRKERPEAKRRSDCGVNKLVEGKGNINKLY